MNDSFCIMPWLNLSTDVNGSLRPCCKFAQPDKANEYQLPNMRDGKIDDLWNHAGFKNLRQAFLDGKRPRECQSCWDEEAAGLPSFRTNFVKSKKLWKHVKTIDLNPITTSTPATVDLKLNNVCNLKCRICGAQASSTYVKEYQEMKQLIIHDASYWMSNKIIDTPNEEIFKEWSKNFYHVEMTGGEPMVSPENIKILQLLVDSGRSSEITIMLNTNATQYNSKFINLLTKFKFAHICLSIDDLNERLEYERYPSKWHIVEQNLLKFLKLKEENKSSIGINLTPTVSIFNVFYLNEYLSWISQFDISFLYFNILHYSPQFSIKNLPKKAKEIVQLRLTDPKFTGVLNFLNLDGDETLLKKFFEDVNELDNFRNQQFRNIFPEWSSILERFRS